MQHSSAVMGLVPMTPEMWLELEPIKHGMQTGGGMKPPWIQRVTGGEASFQVVTVDG